MVEYCEVSGWPRLKRSQLIARTAAWSRSGRCDRFKIGISNWPEARFAQPDYRGRNSRMVVMYASRSLRHIRALEKELIEYHDAESDNVRAGGGGPAGDGPYYLYIVLRVAGGRRRH